MTIEEEEENGEEECLYYQSVWWRVPPALVEFSSEAGWKFNDGELLPLADACSRRRPREHLAAGAAL